MPRLQLGVTYSEAQLLAREAPFRYAIRTYGRFLLLLVLGTDSLGQPPACLPRLRPASTFNTLA